jgi:YggT family protein
LFFAYLIGALKLLVDILSALIVIQAFMSWLPLSEDNVIVRFLNLMTEPILTPIRKLLYRFEFTQELPFDFSPIIAILLLWVIGSILSIL